MFDPDDLDAPDIFGDLGRDAMKVVGPLALLLFAPVLLLIAAFGGLPDAIETSAAPASAAEIPPDQLAVMQQVSNQTGIPWQILAAIARVESGFGANMVPSSAGAVGYCQFLPSTWAAYGVDGDGDGIADPYNFRDCIPAMGRYLTANGAPADIQRALLCGPNFPSSASSATRTTTGSAPAPSAKSSAECRPAPAPIAPVCFRRAGPSSPAAARWPRPRPASRPSRARGAPARPPSC